MTKANLNMMKENIIINNPNYYKLNRYLFNFNAEKFELKTQ